MITLYGGRFHSHIDLFDWWLPSLYAGTHFLKQLAAGPATAEQIGEHQMWGVAATQEILDAYTLSGVLAHDPDTGLYGLDVVKMIEMLDAAWRKFPQEDIEETWECAGRLTCDGQSHAPTGYRGPEIAPGANGPAFPDELPHPVRDAA